MTNEQALKQAQIRVKILISIVITFVDKLENLKRQTYNPKQIDTTESEIEKIITEIDKVIKILI